MRKIFSILCFLLFLAGLPGLFSGIMRSSDIGFIIGLAILPAFCLFGAIVFWKPRPTKHGLNAAGLVLPDGSGRPLRLRLTSKDQISVRINDT